ncbi:MAG: PBP1A family penicillin-binding protein [Filomicrobium sp.]
MKRTPSSQDASASAAQESIDEDTYYEDEEIADDHGVGETGEYEMSDSPRSSRPQASIFARLAVAAVILGGVWLGSMMIYYSAKFPDPLAAQSGKAPTIRILARDGSLLAERGAKHPYIPIDLLPDHVIQAVVAIEDRRFFEHGGVDFSGLIRAAFANLRAGRYAQGGSTITQQLAKNMYLSSERTLTRKFEELSLAVWLEMRLEKRDILELYLNKVYFGSGAYGIEAAAQRYFNKSARALSLVESAIIAGLLKAPSRYAPYTNPAAARKRGRVVLRSMRDAGYLSTPQYKKAQKGAVRFAKSHRSREINGTEYAVDYILERMPQLMSPQKGALIVETSIDLGLQKLAQRTLSETLKGQGTKKKASQGAIVVLDGSGGIRALAGGADYAKSQFNRAVKAKRQPGSTFKPFVFLTALESGMTPTSTTLDLPLSVGGWSPRNINGKYRGEVSLREALARSINTVAVRLALDSTPARVASVARRAGIASDLREDPSLALGTSEVTLLELTGAYALFASGGRRVEPHIVRRIRNMSGRVLYANASSSNEQVAKLRHVGAMNDMLNAALIAGTGRKAALAKHPAAGKTGTSQGFRDAWFVGYTAHMTAGIWLGNDNGKPMDRVVGGSLPAKIWRKVMQQSHRGLPQMPLPGTFRPGTRIGAGRESFVARFEGQSNPPTAAVQRARKKTAFSSKGTKSPSGRIIVRPPKIVAKALAPQSPPPLPGKSGRPPTPIHPKDAISGDFIARALNSVAPAKPQRETDLAGGAKGFDIDEIRRRLQSEDRKAPKPALAREPYMALGAGRRPDR